MNSKFSLYIWFLLFAYVSLFPFAYVSYSESSHWFFKLAPLVFVVLLAFSERRAFFTLSNDVLGITALVAPFIIISFCSLFGAELIKLGIAKCLFYTFTGPVISILLVVCVRKNKFTKDLKKILFFLLFCLLFMSLYTIYAKISGDDIFWERVGWFSNSDFGGQFYRNRGVLGNPSFNGSFMALFLPLTFYVFCNIDEKVRRAIAVAVIFVVIAGLYFTFSRGAWLSSAVGFSSFFTLSFFLLRKLPISWAAFSKAMLLTVFLFGTGLLSWSQIAPKQAISHYEYGKERVMDTFFLKGDEARIAQYYTTWKIIKNNPLLGIGFGNFVARFDELKSEKYPVYITVRTTDNMYLMILCEMGISGFIAMSYALFSVIGRSWQYMRKSTNSDAEILLSITTLSCMSVLLSNMMTWDMLNQTTFRIYFWFLIGVLYSFGSFFGSDKVFRSED